MYWNVKFIAFTISLSRKSKNNVMHFFKFSFEFECDIFENIHFQKSNFKYKRRHLISAKRRSANHPCPVCGKFYVNEGSLRKHLACHPEMTSQLASSLRMWPCTVCTAVFTHENGYYYLILSELLWWHLRDFYSKRPILKHTQTYCNNIDFKRGIIYCQ